MKKTFPYLVISLITLMIINTACTSFTQPQATSTEMPDAVYTASIQTIVAGLTESAPTLAIMEGEGVVDNTTIPTVELPVPTEFVFTDTPLPTETPTVTLTPDYSPTPQPTDTIEPSATATETPIPELVYQDDFSSKIGWTTTGGTNYGFEFINKGYQIFVKVKDVPIWSVRTNTHQDVQVEVDVMEVEDSKGGYFGLVCRHSGGAEFYALVIGSDGFYGIGKKGSGVFKFLKQGAVPPEANLSVDEPNRVRADCMGDTLSLYVNGIKVGEVQDSDYIKGDVGMVVGSRSKGTVTALFDSFAVFSP
ncbi:MAG: hypothetical protein JW908_05930 [Anaerolineales bacterium]|nr:hypothetical protein [Anaerolineales bacterium]